MKIAEEKQWDQVHLLVLKQVLVDGIRLTAFTEQWDNRNLLEEQGAHFITSDDFTSHLEEDRKFITGQNPQSSEVIGKALVNALK